MAQADLFDGEGEMRARMRAHDWAATPVGPPSRWPSSLKTAVRILLDCRLPMYLAWGPGFTQFFNDAYLPILGNKHADALGNSAAATWREIWPTIGPMWAEVLAGRPHGFDDFKLTIERFGFPEDRFFNFSYSAAPDDDGRPAGVLVTFVDTTGMARSETRRAFQLELADTLRALSRPEDIMAAAARQLGMQLDATRVLYAEVHDGAFNVGSEWGRPGVASLAGYADLLANFGADLDTVLAGGDLYAVADAFNDPRTRAQAGAYRAIGVRAHLTVPLIKNGGLAVLLSVHHDQPHHWSDFEIELARDLAECTWTALEGARTQAELRTERDRSRYILDTMEEGFALIDGNWVITQMNAEGLRIIQRHAREVVGRNHWTVFPHMLGTEIEALLRHAKEGVGGTSEHPFQPPGSHPRWVELRVYPEPSGGVAVFFRDITTRREADQKLREADRRKDEFLAMLAHELRNPLAPIGAAADLLQFDGLDPQRIRKTSEVIGRQVRHMTGLIDDLLDVSRVTRGLVTLDKRLLDVGRVAVDAVEQVRPLIEARRHTLVLELSDAPLQVLGDQKRLVQVLSNLLNNAAKYTPEGGRIVLRVDADDDQVAYVVSDNGVGMAPDLVERAFELFVQAKRAADRSQGGLGIGLALVRSLVELHEGSVVASSAGVGQGSAFTVRLPRARHQHAPKEAAAAEIAAPHRRPLRLFVVDDNADAALMLALFLELAGDEVLVETEPLRALERIVAERPDVCLLDIGLPGIDGYEMARRIRAMEGMAHPVLVALTGYGRLEDRKAATAAGFAHHFVKPVDSARLAALLDAIAGGSISQAE